jgi:DNA (cytosine-5)-methyltransferase 1
VSLNLEVVSLFAGVGGIDLAAEHAGMTTRLLCEIDKQCRAVLAHRFPNATIHDDVRTLTADDIRTASAVPRRTVLTAGWPCQGNSVAGRRGGMADPRSGLWREVTRLLAEFRPRWFLGENVPGLLSVNDGRDFAAVIHDLAELGYGFAWRVLDARHFGVPQRRRRVILVGHLGDTGAAPAQVLLEPEGVRWDLAPSRTPWPRTAGRTREGAAVGVLGEHAHTLTAEGADASEDGTGRGTPVVAFGHTNGIDLQADEDVYPTIRAGHDAMPSVAYVADHVTALDTQQGGPDDNSAQGGHLVAVHENQRGEVTISTDLSSLSVGGGKPGQGYPAITDGVIVRRLSPLECERLQGFLDGWTDVDNAADSQRYKEMGNSVAVPTLAWVCQNIAAVDAANAQKRAA